MTVHRSAPRPHRVSDLSWVALPPLEQLANRIWPVLLLVTFLAISPVSQAQVLDGGFEDGSSPWSPKGSFGIGAFTKPHAGRFFAYFGVGGDGHFPALNASGSIEQTITIPRSATNLWLTYWMWVTTTEPDGNVHDKVTVQLQDLSGNTLETRVITNLESTGDYLRHAISVAPYAGRTVRLSFSGLSDGANATTFRLDDVAFVQLANLTTNISGVVRDGSSAAAIPLALVSFAGLTATTRSDGTYSFTNVSCQTATLTASATGYQTASQTYAPNCFAGTNVRNVALVPLPTTLSGTVTDPWSGLPLAGAVIQFAGKTVTSASNGSWGMTLANCASGTLTVTAPRFKPYSVTYTPTCRAANVLNIKPTPEQTSFTVISNENALVRWNGQAPLTVHRNIYVFAGVPCQSATLAVSLPGYVPVSIPYTPICNESSFVTVMLQPVQTNFSGTVRLAGTLVPIANATLDWNGVQVTTADGTFTFWGVPCSVTTPLTVTAAGYLRYRQPYTPACDTNNVKNISLPLAPASGTYICGVVVNSKTGQSVPGAHLTFGPSASSAVTTTSAADGSYCLARTLCGSGTLWSQATTYEPLSESITSICGNVLVHDISLVPSGFSGMIRDRVTEETIPGVTVQWLNARTTSDWQGLFTFTGCGNGPVAITWPGYSPYQYPAITCQVGIFTSFQYAYLQVAPDRAALSVRSYLGGHVEFQGYVATPTESGYLLSNLPCNTAGTLIVSAPRYQEEHLPYVTTCGTTDAMNVTLKQLRTIVSGVVESGPNRIPGAHVSWANYAGTTDDRGNYMFDNVPCGQTGTLVVTKAGFRDATKPVTATCPGYADGSIQLSRQ
jgi:hypothetical protein